MRSSMDIYLTKNAKNSAGVTVSSNKTAKEWWILLI